MRLKREQLLAEMEIVEWKIRRRHLFRGIITDADMLESRLLIISSGAINLEQDFFQDILRLLNFSTTQVTLLSPEKFDLVSIPSTSFVWLLGKGLDNHDISSTHKTIKTPELAELLNNLSYKRALWQQILSLWNE